MPKLGLALSGGGHRATLFTLGALLYLHDSGRNRDVTIITSVSGGSLTNAFLSQARPAYESPQAQDDFEPAISQFARGIAGRRTVWWLSWFVYLVLLAAICGPWIDWTPGARWATAGLGLAIWSFLIGPRSGGSLWSWWGVWLYVGATLGAVAAAISPYTPLEHSLRLALAAAAAAGTLLRHRVAGHAMERFIRAVTPRAASSPPSRILHLLCATEMQSGEQTIFCPGKFIVSPIFGIEPDANFALREGLQPSAGFPVAFPPRRLRSSRFGFPLARHFADRLVDDGIRFSPPGLPRYLVVSDGGIRDNMGTSWFSIQSPLISFVRHRLRQLDSMEAGAWRRNWEVNNRAAIEATLNSLETAAPDEIVAINAAYPAPTQSALHPLIPLFIAIVAVSPVLDLEAMNIAIYLALLVAATLGIGMTLMKVVGAMYRTQNAQQLVNLRQQFLSGTRSGGLVSIEDPPLRTATFCADWAHLAVAKLLWPDIHTLPARDALMRRAKRVLSSVGTPLADNGQFGRDLYEAGRLRRFCRDYPTTLNPVGLEAAAKLMAFGYKVASCSLPVYSESFPLLRGVPDEGEMEALLRQGRRSCRPSLVQPEHTSGAPAA